jgi:hypothetical protein
MLRRPTDTLLAVHRLTYRGIMRRVADFILVLGAALVLLYLLSGW